MSSLSSGANQRSWINILDLIKPGLLARYGLCVTLVQYCPAAIISMATNNDVILISWWCNSFDSCEVMTT